MNRSPYASDPTASRGRRHREPGGGTRGGGAEGSFRTAFQRDRDRVVHSTGFRRLRDKTQVFAAPEGDHYRVRLTHSLEVAQIGRTIARALGLDEDLTEALCLAHDIGHPPFGHAGEAALKDAMADVGGFDHNGQTLRTVALLDAPYPAWAGLNLSWETLEGLAKHNGPVAAPPWALAAVDREYPLDLARHGSLEAQVAAVADDIAYDNHDIDDGLRAGLLSAEQVLAQTFLAASWTAVRARYPWADEAALLRETVREQIGRMVGDVIATTRTNLRDAGIETTNEVRAAGRALAGFSPALAEQERGFKRFMYDELYHHPQQRGSAEQARGVVAALAAAYRGDPALLPETWRETLPAGEPWRARHVADFIAGMTDRYALARYGELIGPPPVLDGV